MDPLSINVEFTEAQRKEVCASLRSSIELYTRYVKLKPETPAMKRKQTRLTARLLLLRMAYDQVKFK